MEIHQLRYFCAVAANENFTRAAEQEHVAQPSLSQQVLKLEDELGAKLFERLGRKAKLTQYGLAFLPKAQKILLDLVEAKAEIQDLVGGSKGDIVLGAIPTIAPYFLPRCIAKFTQLFPDVHLNIVEDITAALLSHLQDGRVDLAITALPISGDNFLTRELFREPLFVVVSRQHALAQRESISLSEIENIPFLLLKDGHCFRETTISACKRSGLKPNIVFESGHFATILAMVCANIGVSIVPEMAIETKQGCAYLPIQDDKAFRRIGVIERKGQAKSKAQRELLNVLRAASPSQF